MATGPILTIGWLALFGFLAYQTVDAQSTRAPWENTRLRGTPEPPHPFGVERVLTQLDWHQPLYALTEPGTNALWIVSQGGEEEKPSRIERIVDDPEASQRDVVFELPRRLVYGLTFSPHYAHDRLVYLFSNGPTGEKRRTNQITRYQVARGETTRIEPTSALTILEWRSEGHDGGDLAFAADGMLYITAGDGSSDSDAWNTGQDLRDLNGSILRIDVTAATPGQPYRVPTDNPFVALAGARPEIWAFGLRNPWRMSYDREANQLWVGTNGQDMWETVHLVERGANFGWSLREGSHPFHAQGLVGPSPPIAPTIEHPHADFRSLTGGVVYRGDKHMSLVGTYIYGDYSTGKIWGGLHDGRQLVAHRELADTTLQIAGFANSPRGDLLIVDHGQGIFRLVEAPQRPAYDFPRWLSETQLFVDCAAHQAHPGLIPYTVHAAAWADGATSERFLALPAGTQIEWTEARGWNFPEGTVLVQTLSLPAESPAQQPRRMETRLLVRYENEWNAYTYHWNDAQSDAELVPAQGADLVLHGVDHRQGNASTWRLPSRSECLACHSRAVGYVLGLTSPQVHHVRDAQGQPVDQLLRLQEANAFRNRPNVESVRPLVDPYDTAHPLHDRARSYLHANCSHCHVEAGGGNARMELEYVTSNQRLNAIGVRPLHHAFGIGDPMLIAPGAPERSVLFHRVSQRGPGQMPPLASRKVDEQGIALLRAWIASLPDPRPLVRHWQLEELDFQPTEWATQRSFEQGRAAFRDLGCRQCHRLGEDGGGAGPDLTGIGQRQPVREIVASMVTPSAKITPNFANTIFETTQGTTVEGRVLQETPEFFLVQTAANPGEPVRLDRSMIEHSHLSTQSLMPTGLLDRLQREEILDLLAYVLADGDRDRPAFTNESTPPRD